MSRRTSSRVKKQIDYSKIGEIEGISDEELGGKLHKDVQSDSDEFIDDDGGKEHEEESDVVPEEDEDEEEEDDVAGEDEYYDVIEVTSTPSKPKGRVKKSITLEELPTNTGPKKLKSTQATKPKSTPPSKAAGSRAESLKERFQLFYGHGAESNVYAINQRKKWGTQVFIPNPELFDIPTEIIELQSKDVYNFPIDDTKPNQKLTTCSVEEVTRYIVGSDRIMKVQTDLESNEQIPLACFESTFIHKKIPNAGVIVNGSGGSFINSATFAPGFHESDIQYLAVTSLIDGGNTSSYQEISGFETKPSPSSIQIYQLDTSIPKDAIDSNDYFKLIAVYCTEYGPISKLAWRPLGPNTKFEPNKTFANHVGTLAASFQDGKARLLDIHTPTSTQPQYYKIDSFLKEYSLDSKITCLAWRNNNSLVTATSDGYIGEFDTTDESSDSQYPSYYILIHNSFINGIECSFPLSENNIFTISTDGYCRMVDVQDLLRTRTISSRYKTYAPCLSFCYQLRSFISIDDPYTCKIIPINRVLNAQTAANITRHVASVSSVAGSYLHPMILSGGADGTLHIGNAIRRSTVNKRVTNTIYKESILWEFDAPEGFPGMCKFVDVFKTKDLPKPPAIDRQFIYPRTSIISAVEWNLNKSAGSWYVAGTSSGILRIENLSLS